MFELIIGVLVNIEAELFSIGAEAYAECTGGACDERALGGVCDCAGATVRHAEYRLSQAVEVRPGYAGMVWLVDRDGDQRML